MKAFRCTSVSQTKLGTSILSAQFNQTLTKQYTSSIQLNPPSLPLSHQTLTTQKLFHKDWLSPNEVVKIFSTLPPNSVLPMLDHISKRKDYKPNETLYTVIINKLAQVKNFDAIDDTLKMIKTHKNCRLSDDFFYDLIKVYGNLGGLTKRVIEILHNMPEYNCWPTTKTFNFVLNLLVNSNDFDVVYEVFVGATSLGVEIDGCTLNIMIKGLCKCGRLEDAFQVLDEFPKQGCKPNKQTFSTIMHCMCGKGMVDEAFGLIKRMEKEGISPDAVTFNILISGLQKQGRTEDSIELLDRMRLMGCNPNKGSYQEVLYGLLKSKRYGDARSFVHRMRCKSLIPSFLSYKELVLGLCEENLLGDVDWVLKSMVSVGFVPRMVMWRNVLEKIFTRHNAPHIVTFSEIVKD
ncbi:pentatricopeptide repeat-containing protein At3g14580, mitochondrial [Beta vulgaris subsp. vulgaris]|uniref:pentatricopeptide repeat-containing protein At3g14580, mitochondrial n=1 Tax=Beta vulgaris subsp. vulgaris TaxID=3555 RepID=UPI0020368284|nr:pentatricopeptide repeat-containing protein At3g14580, mitochondrial [Beta vulgaris subsp. vulgaris]